MALALNNKRKREETSTGPKKKAKPVETKPADGGFDMKKNTENINKEYLEDLKLFTRIQEHKDEVDDICTATIENKKKVITSFLKTENENTYTWELIEASSTAWMDEQYKKRSANLIWKIYVITDPLDKVVEKEFAKELERKCVDGTKTFALAIDAFVKAYPHKEYPTISLYIKNIHKIFTAHEFPETTWKGMMGHFINGLLSGYDKKKRGTELNILRAKKFKGPAIPGIRQVRRKVNNEVKKRLDETIAAAEEEMQGVEFNNEGEEEEGEGQED